MSCYIPFFFNNSFLHFLTLLCCKFNIHVTIHNIYIYIVNESVNFPTMILISVIYHESCNVSYHLFAFQILINIHDSSSHPEA